MCVKITSLSENFKYVQSVCLKNNYIYFQLTRFVVLPCFFSRLWRCIWKSYRLSTSNYFTKFLIHISHGFYDKTRKMFVWYVSLCQNRVSHGFTLQIAISNNAFSSLILPYKLFRQQNMQCPSNCVHFGSKTLQ